MLRCIIIDDQPQAIQVLKNHIKKIPLLGLTGSFSDPAIALAYIKNNPAEIVFLNISKPIQKEDYSISIFQCYATVILTSVNQKFALYGFEQNVIDFLIKPVLYDRFKKAIEKVSKLTYEPQLPIKERPTASLKGGFVFIKEATRLIRLELDDIYYVMGLKNYVSIQTKSHRIVSLQTMKEMEELLPAHRFIRVHRSYFVALDKIVFVEKQQIHLKDKVIPIGQMYLPFFIKKLANSNHT
jgi:DNA-binding LytR/AlgR family response regulator